MAEREDERNKAFFYYSQSHLDLFKGSEKDAKIIFNSSLKTSLTHGSLQRAQ